MLRESPNGASLARCTWIETPSGDYLRASTFPERAARSVPRDTDAYVEYLRKRWSEGCFNARTLMREITERGYHGSYDAVKRRVATWRQPRHDATCTGTDATGAKNSHRRTSSVLDGASFCSSCGVAAISASGRTQTSEATTARRDLPALPSPRGSGRVGKYFLRSDQARQAGSLSSWIAQVSAATVTPELRRFALGLLADGKAVEAALTLPWSNGQTEGQVNRLKLLKREMYGRANLDLLNQRFLHSIQ